MLFAFFIFAGTLVFLAVAFEILRVYYYAKRASYDSRNSRKFERKLKNPKMRILVTGDSTGFGLALKDNKKSIAGRLSKDFPNANIENESVSGFTTGDLRRTFGKQKSSKYDLIIFMIGGNDVIKFKNLAESYENLKDVIGNAKSLSKKIVLMPSGNVGLSPIFFFISSMIYTHRARVMRESFMNLACDEKVMYVDLFNERKDEESLKDVDLYYCKDYLHPSEALYGIWYDKLRQVLEDKKVLKG